MHELIHSNYQFSKEIKTIEEDGSEKTHKIILDVEINHKSKTYNITQNHQEGIFPNKNNKNTYINKAYMELCIEALNFIEKEIYSKKEYDYDNQVSRMA